MSEDARNEEIEDVEAHHRRPTASDDTHDDDVEAHVGGPGHRHGNANDEAKDESEGDQDFEAHIHQRRGNQYRRT